MSSPARVCPAADCARARPKSATLTRPSAVSRTFSGLTSRCTIPEACAAASPSSTPAMISSAVAGGNRPLSLSSSLERAPGHVLHRQVQERAVGALVEDGDHVLVRQPRHRLGLADEPADEFLVPGQFGVHDLERHLAVKPRVGGPVDRGHPAVRDARGHRVAPVEQAPGEGIGQGIVHRDDFTVVLPIRRVNHCVPGGQARLEVVAEAATSARSAHHMGPAAAADPKPDRAPSGPGVISRL